MRASFSVKFNASLGYAGNGSVADVYVGYSDEVDGAGDVSKRSQKLATVKTW